MLTNDDLRLTAGDGVRTFRFCPYLSVLGALVRSGRASAFIKRSAMMPPPRLSSVVFEARYDFAWRSSLLIF